MKPLKPASQTERILAHLARGHTLTAYQALAKFDCLALSQRCTFLRSRGHDIRSEMIRTRTGKTVARYELRAR